MVNILELQGNISIPSRFLLSFYESLETSGSLISTGRVVAKLMFDSILRVIRSPGGQGWNLFELVEDLVKKVEGQMLSQTHVPNFLDLDIEIMPKVGFMIGLHITIGIDGFPHCLTLQSKHMHMDSCAAPYHLWSCRLSCIQIYMLRVCVCACVCVLCVCVYVCVCCNSLEAPQTGHKH